MLHTEHAYCLSYCFLNNVVTTTVIEMVEMVEILDGRLGKRSVERVRYVTRKMVPIPRLASSFLVVVFRKEEEEDRTTTVYQRL